MRTLYAQVLRWPDVLPAFGASLLGRAGLAAFPVALLSLVLHRTGELAPVALVLGAYAATALLLGPLRARWADLVGAAWVLPRLGWCSVAAQALVALAALLGTPVPLLAVLAGTAGLFPPPFGPVMRGVWADRSASADLRSRAYSLDTAAGHLALLIGAGAAGLLSATAFGAALAVLLAASAVLVGSRVLARVPFPAVGREDRERSVQALLGQVGPLDSLRFWPVLLTVAAVGIGLGAVGVLPSVLDVELDFPRTAGAGAVFATVGGAVSGLLYGTFLWRTSRWRLLAVLTAGVCAVLLLSAGSTVPAVLAILLLALDLLAVPALVTGYLLADEHARSPERTEASALIESAAWAGGALVLVLSPSLLALSWPVPALLVTVLAGLIAGCGGLLGLVSRGLPTEQAERTTEEVPRTG